jgi:hypothetical protein
MDPFHITKVLPLNGIFSIQVENGYLSLYIFRVVMESELLLQAE